jgi:hypothetical protein
MSQECPVLSRMEDYRTNVGIRDLSDSRTLARFEKDVNSVVDLPPFVDYLGRTSTSNQSVLNPLAHSEI